MTRKPKPTPAPADDEAASFMASVALPVPPYTVRDDSTKLGTVSITESGLRYIRQRASDGASQVLISAELGISKATFQAAMKRDEKVRVAFEHGHAELEQELVSILVSTARKGAFIPAMFLLKSKFGFVEGAAPVSTAPQVTIVLPDSYSPEQYLRVINERPKVTRPVLASPSGKQEVAR